jgi:hypothetical protein
LQKGFASRAFISTQFSTELLKSLHKIYIFFAVWQWNGFKNASAHFPQSFSDVTVSSPSQKEIYPRDARLRLGRAGSCMLAIIVTRLQNNPVPDEILNSQCR